MSGKLLLCVVVVRFLVVSFFLATELSREGRIVVRKCGLKEAYSDQRSTTFWSLLLCLNGVVFDNVSCGE